MDDFVENVDVNQEQDTIRMMYFYNNNLLQNPDTASYKKINIDEIQKIETCFWKNWGPHTTGLP